MLVGERGVVIPSNAHSGSTLLTRAVIVIAVSLGIGESLHVSTLAPGAHTSGEAGLAKVPFVGPRCHAQQMSDPMLRAINVILDMLVAHDEDADDAVNILAIRTAFEALNGAGAVSATFDDETDELDLDITPLLTAVGVTIQTLVDLLAMETSKDDLTVVSELREHLNRVFASDD